MADKTLKTRCLYLVGKRDERFELKINWPNDISYTMTVAHIGETIIEFQGFKKDIGEFVKDLARNMRDDIEEQKEKGRE